MFEDQIKNLLENIQPPNTPYELDLVMEGGGFNGSYEVGILLFLRELEKKEYIQIQRFSGASIGAILSLAYIVNDLDDYVEMYSILRQSWRDNINLQFIQDRIKTMCDKITPDIFETLKDDKLYITFYNIETQTQIIQSSYTTTDDIYHTLLKTCHIPYIIDNTLSYQHKEQYFIDGGQPFIFHNREKSLYKKIMYVSINQFTHLFSMMSVKHELNPYGRILAGMLDCYEFFYRGCSKPSLYCSFVNDWTIQEYILLRIKHILLVLCMYCLYGFIKVKDIILPYIDKFGLYKQLYPILNNLYKDIFLSTCF